MLRFQIISFHPERINAEWVKTAMHSSETLEEAVTMLTEIHRETLVSGKECFGAEVVEKERFLFSVGRDGKRINVKECVKTGSYIGYDSFGDILLIMPLKKGNWNKLTGFDLYQCRKCGFSSGMSLCEELCQTCSAEKYPSEHDEAELVCRRCVCPSSITQCPRCGYDGSEGVLPKNAV